MKNFTTLYSHQLCFDTILEEIKNTIPKAKLDISERNGLKIIHVSVKSGFLKPKKECQFSYRERNTPSYNLSTIDSPLTQNLAGMAGFVSSLSSQNEEIKAKLIQKIQTLNSECSVLSNGDLTSILLEISKNISQSTDGISFNPPSKIIESQHFLDKNQRLILDLNGNSEIEHLDIKINSSYFDDNQKEVTEDQKERKLKTNKSLENNGIKINQNLPHIESEEHTTLRTKKEIAERLVILAVTNLVAFSKIKGDQALYYLKTNKITELATPKEIDFLNNTTDEKKNHETWKCEGIWVLLWALGIAPELSFPNKMVELTDIPALEYPIQDDVNPNDFIAKEFDIRTKSEILDANDMYYRLNWACVDARIKGQAMNELIAGVVYERQYALNWLIKYMDQSWDNVSCDT